MTGSDRPPPGDWKRLVKTQVRRRYDYMARTGDFPPDGAARALRHGYAPARLAALPADLAAAYCGAGDPLTGLDPGAAAVIVDLGCGAGMDLLAAALAGPDTLLVGVDLSPAMLQRLVAAAPPPRRVGLLALAADMEALPLADAVADLAIGNASFNLCVDADRAFAEAHRILKPGGRLALAEFVRLGPLPIEAAANPLAWSASIGGIQEPAALAALLDGAGFSDIAMTDPVPAPPVHAVRVSARKPA